MASSPGAHTHGCGHGCACHRSREPRCVVCVMLTTQSANRPDAWASRWPGEPYPAHTWQDASCLSEAEYVEWLEHPVGRMP